MFPNLPQLGKAESVWIDTTPTLTRLTPALPASIDTIVIGGGIAGLTTAYLLQTSGARVAVLEANEILKGVTGYTTAKVTSLHTLIYDKLIRTFGEEQARMYGEANQAGLNKIAEWTDDMQIDCDFKHTSAYTYADSEDMLRDIEAEVQAAQRLGLPASFVRQIPLPVPNKGAVMFSGQAQFHPRKYLLKIAEAFTRAGGLIFERLRVMGVEEGRPCTVKTERGDLRATYVVVASHYPIYDPALYFSRLAPYRSLVLGVRLSEKAPEGMYITGSSEMGHSFRNQPMPDGELFLVGGEGYKVGQGGDVRERYKRLEAFARDHFPVTSVDYHWATQDNDTLDHVPYIGPIGPKSTNVFVATGFHGWGMTNGTAAGLILSDLIMRGSNPWADLFNPNRIKPAASAKSFITEGVNVAKEVVESYLPVGGAKDVTKLAAGEGMIVRHDRERLAVCRDLAGILHAVTAKCSHMGCDVAWNYAEHSWDCPCHGSRFDVLGKVIHGPAVKDLERRSVPEGTEA